MHLWKRNFLIWEKLLQIFHVEATIGSIFHSYLLIFCRNLHATKSPFKVKYAFIYFQPSFVCFLMRRNTTEAKLILWEAQAAVRWQLHSKYKCSCFYEKKQKSLQRTLSLVFLLVQCSVQRNNAGKVGSSNIWNICFVRLLKV